MNIRSLGKLEMTIVYLFFILSFIFTPKLVFAYINPNIGSTSSTATVAPIVPTTSDTTSPTTPILVRPTDGTITSNNTPEFVWRRSSDPNGNVVIYTLYLNGIATYLGISDLGNSSGNGYTAILEEDEIKLQVTTPLSDSVYSWQVTATDGSGNTSHSTTWSLTIDSNSPSLSIVDLDTYHYPIIVEGSNFDIDGPKDIRFALLSDPYTTIQLSISGNEGILYNLQGTSSSTGLSYLYQYLIPGIYSVTILAIDLAGNITILPTFTLTIHQSSVTVIIPGITEPIINVPYTPLTILPSSLPATVSLIFSRGLLPYLVTIALAIILGYLLFCIWNHRYNLILLNDQGLPLKNTIIYHSIPMSNTKFTKGYLAKRSPISYALTPSDLGRIYIPHLGRYSTLTIRLENEESCTTYIMSLSVTRKLYNIILG